jgi:hypothetical protein
VIHQQLRRQEIQVSSASLRNWNNGVLEYWNNGFEGIPDI